LEPRSQCLEFASYTEETWFHNNATEGKKQKGDGTPIYMKATTDLLLLALMGIIRN
jgi:hypothetical protein